MPTKPKQTEQDILAEARHILAKAKAHAKAFRDADKARKVKHLDPSRVTAFARTLSEATKAVGGQAAGKSRVKVATSTEETNRKKLFDALTSIRDDVALAHPDDKPLGRAFGVGARILPGSTPSLLKAASHVVEAYSDPGHKQLAADAGVTAARITAVKRAHAALADADTAQNTAMGAKKGTTTGKNQLFRTLKSEIAHIRKVAQHVFKGNAEKLAEFKSTLARRTPKLRSAKKAAPKPE